MLHIILYVVWLPIIESNKMVFRNFIAGFIDADGCINKKYACIVQKDKKYLIILKKKMKKLLDLNFNGPYINKKIDNKPVGWWLINGDVEDVLKKVPLRYKGV